jgi:hypothetical protein
MPQYQQPLYDARFGGEGMGPKLPSRDQYSQQSPQSFGFQQIPQTQPPADFGSLQGASNPDQSFVSQDQQFQQMYQGDQLRSWTEKKEPVRAEENYQVERGFRPGREGQQQHPAYSSPLQYTQQSPQHQHTQQNPLPEYDSVVPPIVDPLEAIPAHPQVFVHEGSVVMIMKPREFAR